jgi:hypothetical protein
VVVLGDVDSDGQVEVVSARNHNERDKNYTSAVVVKKLDGSVLWQWGNPTIGRSGLHHDVACQIHDLVGDAAMEIGSALPRGLFDGYGRRMATFSVGEGEEPWLMMAVDLTGRGMRDVMLVTSESNRYRVYLYKNRGSASNSAGVPMGSGVNFTLY